MRTATDKAVGYFYLSENKNNWIVLCLNNRFASKEQNSNKHSCKRNLEYFFASIFRINGVYVLTLKISIQKPSVKQSCSLSFIIYQSKKKNKLFAVLQIVLNFFSDSPNSINSSEDLNFLQSLFQVFYKISNYYYYYYYYYYYSFRVFHISSSSWFFTEVWVTANLLNSPGLVPGFWPITVMLSFG